MHSHFYVQQSGLVLAFTRFLGAVLLEQLKSEGAIPLLASSYFSTVIDRSA